MFSQAGRCLSLVFDHVDRYNYWRTRSATPSFFGLRHSSQIPDRTTIWNFKERLIQAGASESIFDAVNRQLSIHGIWRAVGR